jgi:hypothetical protein
MPTRAARRCTEMLPQETYFARDGVRDMFWPHAMNASAIAQVGAHLLPCTIHRCGYRYMCNDRCCRDFLVLQPCDCCNPIGDCPRTTAVVRQQPWLPRGQRVVPAWSPRGDVPCSTATARTAWCRGRCGSPRSSAAPRVRRLQPSVGCNEQKTPTHPHGSARCATSRPRGGTWRRSATRHFLRRSAAAQTNADGVAPASVPAEHDRVSPLHCVATWSGVATRVVLLLLVRCGAALHWCCNRL